MLESETYEPDLDDAVKDRGFPVLSHQLNHLQNFLLLFGTTEFQHFHDSAVHIVTVFIGLESIFTVKEAVDTAVKDIRNPDECGQGWMGTAMLDIGDMAGVYVKQVGDCLLRVALCGSPFGDLLTDCPVIQFFHDRFPFL